MRLFAVLFLIPLAVAACSNQGLRDLSSNSGGPDEFMIAPVKPLESPSSYNALPVPTPGQANLTDRNPLMEGVTAFGGNPAATTGPVPAADGALVAHASRLGVNGDIRETLAQTDADFRRRRGRLTQFRIVPVDRYNQVYKKQALNAQNEAARWRRAGARTPSAPPAARSRLR